MVALDEHTYQKWLRKRKWTTIAFAIQNTLLGLEYSIIMLNMWIYIEQLVKPDHPKIYYSIISVSCMMSSAILSIFTSRMADRYRNIRSIFLATNLSLIIGNIIYMIPFSPWFLLAGRIIAGAGHGQSSVISGELARCYSPNELTSKFSLMGMCNAFGFMIAPGINIAVSSVDFTIGNWHITFANFSGIYLAVIYLIAQVMVIFMIHNISKEYDQKYENEKLNVQNLLEINLLTTVQADLTLLPANNDKQLTCSVSNELHEKTSFLSQDEFSLSTLPEGCSDGKLVQSEDEILTHQMTRDSTVETLLLPKVQISPSSSAVNKRSDNTLLSESKNQVSVSYEHSEDFSDTKLLLTNETIDRLVNKDHTILPPEDTISLNNLLTEATSFEKLQLTDNQISLNHSKVDNVPDKNLSADDQVSLVCSVKKDIADDKLLSNDQISINHSITKHPPNETLLPTGVQIPLNESKAYNVDEISFNTLSISRDPLDSSVIRYKEHKSSTKWLCMQVIIHADTALLMCISFLESFLIISFDMCIPILVIDILKWSVMALNIITLSSGVASILPCFILMVKKFSDHHVFYASVLSVFAYALIQLIQIMLSVYNTNFTINIILTTFYCLLFANVMVIKDVFLGSFLAKMVSSIHQSLTDSVRVFISRLGAITAVMVAPFALEKIEIIGWIYICIILTYVFLMLLRRNTLKCPNVIIKGLK